jgi:hypothetical protein
MACKEELKRLIDQLPEGETDKVLRLIVSLLPGRDSLAQAPLDDKPTTKRDAAAVREGRAEFSRGETLSSADARRRLLG